MSAPFLRVLDVGCGTGYFAAAARELGYHVSGLDLSRPQLELARTRFGLSDLHAMTLFDYARTVPLHSFDIVTAFQVLEHVADPLAFLGDARRLLATGGHLAVGVPNWRVWRMLREPFDHPPHHLTRWSRHGLSRVLDRSGFEVLKIRKHRSGYSFMLRHLRLGLLRRAMGGSWQAAGTKAVPSGVVMALSIAKTRTLMALDLPVQTFLTVIRAPAITLYGLARVPE